jgi:carboxypeptidase Q
VPIRYLQLAIICFVLLIDYNYSAAKVDSITVNQIVKTTLQHQTGYQLLAELCALGYRLSGSESSLRAINWAKNKLQTIGCDTVWLQSVQVPHWERGDTEDAQIVNSSKFENKRLNIASLGGSIGTADAGITGKILEVNSFENLLKLKSQAQDKIIFFNQAFNQGFLNTFQAYGVAVKQRTQGAIAAAKVGAIGSIVRSVTSKYDNVPHVGMMSYEEGIKQIPSASIGVIDADFLSKALIEDPNLKVTIKLSCRNLRDTESFNVIGEIRGVEFPKQVILVGGHFDAWDKGDGAHDDGAGCIQAMEVLHLFRYLNIQPKHTIRCVLFIDEEQKQTGAKTYANYALSTKENHLAAIESDRGAFSPRGFTIDSDSSTIEHIQDWLPFLKSAGIDWVRKGSSGADVSKIKTAKARIGYVPDDQRYFDFHHSENDVFASINAREMELGTAAMAILTYLLDKYGLNEK